LPDYRCYRVPGGCYFFTANLLERFPNDTLVRHVDLLRVVVRDVRRRWPFRIDGWVVLPDHLHCIWTLPAGDADFTTRWRLIKAGFAKRLPQTEHRSRVRVNRGERGIWQRRFWEHAIRDERDYANHMDYLHFNPVKHGHVRRVADWPYSSFTRCVEQGIYPYDSAGAGNDMDRVVGERG
jgi:putative transposase